MNLFEFLKTSFQNVRSSKRTDRLHKVVLDGVLSSNADWAKYDWKFEYTLKKDGFNGTFKLDIVGLDSNGDIKVVILDKAYQSSVNKNIKNFANTTIGESARVFYSPLCQNIEKILFVSVMPRVAPMFTKNGDIKGFDDVVRSKGRTKIDHILSDQYDGIVESIDLYYDIADLKSKKSKSDFDSVDIANLDQLVFS